MALVEFALGLHSGLGTTVVYIRVMSRTDPQLKIRLPVQLRDQVEAAAALAGRTINSEVVARLAESFTGPENESGWMLAAFLKSQEDILLRVDAIHKFMQHLPDRGGLEIMDVDEVVFRKAGDFRRWAKTGSTDGSGAPPLEEVTAKPKRTAKKK